MFKPYFDLWMNERKEKGIKSEWLFVTYKDGNYLSASTSTANSWAVKIGKVAGCDYYNHSSRHAFVTHAKDWGYSESAIQKIVGWNSIDMVQRYDDHTDTEELERFVAELQQKKKEERGE